MTQEIEEACVNGAVLTLFAGAVDQGFRRDVLDCGLYVQLAATKQFDRFTQFHDWQAALIKALTAFGWLRLDVTSEQQEIREAITVADLLQQMLQGPLGCLPAERMEHLCSTLMTGRCAQAAKALVDNSVQTSSSDGVSSVALQVAFVLPSRQMALLGLAFETRATIGPDPFVQRLMKEQLIGDLKSFAFVGTLDDLRYTPYRQRIQDALEQKRSQQCSAVKGGGI